MKIMTPSIGYQTLKGKLAEIAILAKAANQMDLYNQAKEAYDDMVRQYNAQRPKPSSHKRWGSIFSDERDVVISAPDEYFEDNSTNQVLYEHAKTLSQYELKEQLRKAINSYNSYKDFT